MYSGALISGAVSGPLAAGFKLGMDGKRDLNGWRWMFILEGVLTVVVGLIFQRFLPNFPKTTKWLSDRERALAVWYVLVWQQHRLEQGLTRSGDFKKTLARTTGSAEVNTPFGRG